VDMRRQMADAAIAWASSSTTVLWSARRVRRA
jgi:hypothetical protein